MRERCELVHVNVARRAALALARGDQGFVIQIEVDPIAWLQPAHVYIEFCVIHSRARRGAKAGSCLRVIGSSLIALREVELLLVVVIGEYAMRGQIPGIEASTSKYRFERR